MESERLYGLPPAASYRDPIWYRGYRIYLGLDTAWEFQHDDYDGAEDSGDARFGFGKDVHECRDRIDEIEDAQ